MPSRNQRPGDLFYASSPACCRRWQILALRDLTEVADGGAAGGAQIGASRAMQSEG